MVLSMARPAGAIISITTRSGANQFHGGVFYAGRNDALDANDWFSNHNGTGKAEESRNDYGYNISGPAIKDKLFFWWNQEWNKEIQGSSFATCVPTAAEAAGDFQRRYGTARQRSMRREPSRRFRSSPRRPAIHYKIANPDAAGLLIAQFYPARPARRSTQRKQLGCVSPEPVELERVECPRRL